MSGNLSRADEANPLNETLLYFLLEIIRGPGLISEGTTPALILCD